MKLLNKVAIVTGGAMGVGKSICLGFAEEGADIVVADIKEEEDELLPGTIYQTAQEVEALGRRALAARCDVTSEDDVKRMVESILGELGRIDILVNNAAIIYYNKAIDTSLEQWERLMSVNLRGTFLCIKHVLPHMIKQGSGSIINISSRVATRSTRGVAYAATKAAIDRFTWGLAEEVGKYNIAVNALKPRRPVLTETNKLANPNADWSQWDPPERMVKAAIFLAAQDAGGVTGVVAQEDQIRAWHGLS